MVLVYYGLKFVGRLLFPIVVKKAVNNMQARQYTYSQKKPEGEVTIETNRRPKGRAHDAQGEYVDFEEVD